ncbi:hypothetical protein CAMRE0001_1822 [Campylobacter rectus RM3267]|uniref:Uncharacterized protein n=2 Tax=Campylobacter rectus TaxID=203 RepID=A0A6G5QPZ3_CAMRE|nr:hypothetical protein [Campylobacter rectus]EEF15226.1 hypothetical protein CAMRE0001_1822 [Campylobacter rectus RM3267]QCD47632.1 hypothetical protein CRECT_2028 [Campylobacter rectus]UEB48331.1 hypothetical protein LK437_03165 [Campylobacter rectus]
MINENFKKWALGFSGCDGGDIGSAQSPSIWLCGLEWGGGFKPEELADEFKDDVSKPSAGYESHERNLAYQYNIKALKLLCALSGASDHVKFNETVKPFTQGAKGYFKLNLYPLAFKNTSHSLWSEGFAEATGLENKSEYIRWIEQNRFPRLRVWAKERKPRLIICVGISYKNEFIVAFGDEGAQVKEAVAGGKKFYYFKNEAGTIVAITYFLGNPHGLNSDAAIKATGEKIAQILAQNIE